MTEFPRPFRATVGLIASTLDSVRTAPEKAIEFPMMAVSTALQFTLQAQQRYLQLSVRGDEVLGRFRSIPDGPPSWATFDEPVPTTTVVDDEPVTPSKTSPPKRTTPTKASTRKATAAKTSAPRVAKAKKISTPKAGRLSAFDNVADDS